MNDAELQEIRQAFALESAELLVEMESSLLTLEVSTGDGDELNRLFRMIHTIKGSAGIVGCEPLEHFCHTIEHILVRIRDKELELTQAIVSLFLKCHDHISDMVEDFCTNAEKPPLSNPVLHTILVHQLDSLNRAFLPHEITTQEYGMLDDSYLDHDVRPENHADENSSPAEELNGDLFAALAENQHAKAAHEQNRHTVRVDASKLDQLADLITELVTASSILESNVRRVGDSSSIESTTHVSSLIKQIQEKSMVFRMIPVQTLFRRFQRIIHDSGSESGKEIAMQISGGETELDKVVAEKLYDPLLHLVRNAVDHGIETKEVRIAKGKPETGTILFQAVHDAGNIIIRIIDDGKGIDLQKVAQKAFQQGLLKTEAVAGKNICNLIFEPGFSTLDEATKLSGRGVGMDVVKKTVESLRGRVEVETSEGYGSTFSITIPLSLSLVDGFMVDVAGINYILPMEEVLETLELPDLSIPGSFTNGCLMLREKPLPCLDVRSSIGVSGAASAIQYVVVVKHGSAGVGLIVDHLLGEVKAVIKPLGPLFRNVTCVSGASILGDGSVALFLEAERLITPALN